MCEPPLAVFKTLACEGDKFKADWLKLRPTELGVMMQVDDALGFLAHKVAVHLEEKRAAASRHEIVIACAF
jgi:hypothetical protein